MAKFETTFQLIGKEGVLIPAAPVDPIPLEIPQMGTSATYQIKVGPNPITDRDVQIPSVGLEVTGPSAAKVNVSLVSNAIVIPAGGEVEIGLVVEANELINELDSITVRIFGNE